MLSYTKTDIEKVRSFMNSNTTDVKLPDCLKNVEENDLDEILAGIERVIDNGKLYELTSLTEKV